MAIGQHHVEHPPRSAVDVIRMFTHPCVILIAHPARSVMHDCQLRIEVSDLVLRSGEHHSPQTARPIVVTHEIGLLVACGTYGNQPRRKSAIPSVTVDPRHRLAVCGKSPAPAGDSGQCGKACADPAHCLPKGTRFHDLRHFYASTLIAANLNPR